MWFAMVYLCLPHYPWPQRSCDVRISLNHIIHIKNGDCWIFKSMPRIGSRLVDESANTGRHHVGMLGPNLLRVHKLFDTSRATIAVEIAKLGHQTGGSELAALHQNQSKSPLSWQILVFSSSFLTSSYCTISFVRTQEGHLKM